MPAIHSPIRLSDHVHIVYSESPHCHSANSYLIHGTHPVLIDCGSERAVPALLANLDQLGVSVTDLYAVLATHGDYDHIDGFHELSRRHPGMELRIHPSDWPTSDPGARFRNSSYVYNRPFRAIAPEQCREIHDGDSIAAGDGFLQVIHTPGHTDGSVCFLGEIDGTGMLFSGDAFGGAMKCLESNDIAAWVRALAEWRASLDALSALPFAWVLNGHEPARSVPLPRAAFDAGVAQFGTMLSPWFSLGSDQPDDRIPEALVPDRDQP